MEGSACRVTVSIDISRTDEDATDTEEVEDQNGQEAKGERQIHEEADEEIGKRKQKLPKRFKDYEMYMAFDAISYLEKVPESVEELEKTSDGDLWTEAMEREIKSIDKNNT
ncbi:hypothetical protein Trydic_g16321 [Trypoxylus dichotomus]